MSSRLDRDSRAAGISCLLCLVAGLLLLIGIGAVWAHRYSPDERRADAAQARFDALQRRHASGPELCAAARELQQAYRQSGEEDRYRSAAIDAQVECYGAAVEKRLSR